MHHELSSPTSRLRCWWNGEAGLREALVISVPLVISSLSWTVMNFIDRLFLLRYSDNAIAAALPAGIMSFAVICFPLGIASYASTFVAQYFGAGRLRQIGPMVWQAVWLGLITVPLAIAAIPFAPLLFAESGNSESISRLEIEYFRTLSYSGGAMVLSAALSAFFSGRGNVRVVMVVDTLAAVLNVGLDYAWIFGNWGFPEAGIAGAGWATTVAIWFKTLVYFALFLSPRFQRDYGTLSGWRPSWALIVRLFRYSFPGGLQMVLEVAAFGTFTLLIGKLGSEALAATSLAFNVNNFAFMPIWGIGMATSTMVGRRLGEERPELATRAVWSCLAWSLLYMGAICLFYVVFPQLILMPHRWLADKTEHYEGLEALTIILLRFVAAFGLFDAVNIIFAGALKGAGDVKFVLVASVSIAIVSVGLTYGGLLAGLGLYWCWCVLTLWVVLLMLVFRHRFLHGPWRTMRVIEPE